MSRMIFRKIVIAMIFVATPVAAQIQPAGQKPPAAQTPPEAESPQASAAPAPSPEEAQLLKSTEAYVRNLFAWGPGFQVKLGPLSPSPAPDFYLVPLKVTFSGQTDNGVFFVSKDGKTFVRGEMFSMNSDPFTPNRSKLHPDADPTKGPADARATIYVFSDFQCPHCRQFYMMMKTIEPRYPSLRIIYKDFPIVAVHPWALTAAVGARCAYMQKPAAFWTIHDMIFDDQDVISAENVWEKLVDFAGRAGLDKEAFRGCLSAIEPQKQIETDVIEGQALNLNSTPTIFINGRPVPGGDQPTVQQYLDYELGTQSAGAAPRAAPGPPAAKP